MKRFVFLFVSGALLLLAGQVVLSVGLHPEHLHSLGPLLQGTVGLVLGSALTVTGMLGLAEGHERAAGQVDRLLATRHLTDTLEVEVKSPEDLAQQGHRFWKAYQRPARGLCLFMAGLLLLSAFLGKVPLVLYFGGLALGIVLFGATALILSFQGLRGMRRTHRALATSAAALETLPELTPKDSSAKPPQQWAILSEVPRPSRSSEPRRSPAQQKARR